MQKGERFPFATYHAFFAKCNFLFDEERSLETESRRRFAFFILLFFFLQCLFGFVFTKGDLTQVTFTKYKKLGNAMLEFCPRKNRFSGEELLYSTYLIQLLYLQLLKSINQGLLFRIYLDGRDARIFTYFQNRLICTGCAALLVELF